MFRNLSHTKGKFLQTILQAVLLSLIVMFTFFPSQATTVKMLTDQELILSSQVIVQGKVIAIESRFGTDNKQIYTYVTVLVKKVFKGEITTQEIVLRQIGGQIGGQIQKVYGTPSFSLDEKVLLYLNATDDGALRVAHLFMGKFTISKDSETGKNYVRRNLDLTQIKILDTQDNSNITNEMRLSEYKRQILETLKTNLPQTNAFNKINSNKPFNTIPKELDGHIPLSTSNNTINQDNISQLSNTSNKANLMYKVNFSGMPASFTLVIKNLKNLSSPTNLHYGGQTKVFGFQKDQINSISFNDKLDQIDDLVNCNGVLAINGVVATIDKTEEIQANTYNKVKDVDIVLNKNVECFKFDPLGLEHLLNYETLIPKTSDSFAQLSTNIVFFPAEGFEGSFIQLICNRNFSRINSITFEGTNAASVSPLDPRFPNIVRAQVPKLAKSEELYRVFVTDSTLGQVIAVPLFRYKGEEPPPQLPVISNYSPTNGVAGTEVRIEGRNFAANSQVIFGVIPAADSDYLQRSSNLIRVKVPQLPPAAPPNSTTGLIHVKNAVGFANTSPGIFVVNLPPPTVTSVRNAKDDSTQGTIGDLVNIFGQNFAGDPSRIKVYFSKDSQGIDKVQVPPQQVKLISSTQIQANVPFRAVTGPVFVETIFGISLPGVTFRVNLPPAPTITSFCRYDSGNFCNHDGKAAVVPNPQTSEQEGSLVEIRGANLATVHTVKFAGVKAKKMEIKYDSKNDTFYVEANVPFGACTGKIKVTNLKTGVKTNEPFRVLNCNANSPTVNSLSLYQAPAGTWISIYGSNFLNNGNVNLVEFENDFDTVSSSFNIISDTEIQAMVPHGATVGQIFVTNNFGTGSSEQDFTVVEGNPCTYSLSPKSQTFPSSGGTTSFNITTQTGCNWTASSNSSWITTTSSGNGNGMVSYTVAANQTTSSRTGTITVANQTFTVTQNGTNSTTLSISPSSLSFTATQGAPNPANQDFNITSNPSGVNWTVSTNAAWLVVTPSSGTTPTTAIATVNTSALGTGIYNGQITISASGTSVNLPVSLVITSSQETLTVSTTFLQFTTQQGSNPPTKPLTINSASGSPLSWNAVDNAGWLYVTPPSGQTPSNTSVGVDVSGLTAGTYQGVIAISAPNVAVINVNITLTVTSPQSSLIVTPPSLSFSAIQGSTNPSGKQISISSSNGTTLGWSVAYSGTNPTILSMNQTVGTTPATPTVFVTSSNLPVGIYSAKIIISSPGAINSSIEVNVSLSIMAASCAYSLLPTSQGFQALGGTGTFNVSTSSGCSWTAVSNDSWITINSGSGTGNNSVIYTVATNPTTSSRSSSITVGDQAFSITQQAGQSSCSYSLEPSNQSLPSVVSSGSFRVNTLSSCSWVAVNNNPEWINITNGSQGTGARTIFYAITANTSPFSRIGTITVAGQIFTITQSGNSSAINKLKPLSPNFSLIDSAYLQKEQTRIRHNLLKTMDLVSLLPKHLDKDLFLSKTEKEKDVNSLLDKERLKTVYIKALRKFEGLYLSNNT